VLVNGGAGGVGSFAVQIATALGAEVTGVCSTGNVDLVESIGAAHVIDYSKDDFTEGRVHYDVIQDSVGNHPLSRLRRALTPTGTLVTNAGGSPSGQVFGPIGGILRVLAVNGFVRQRLRPLPDTWTRDHLLAVTALIEAGQVTPAVGRTYPLADTAAGLRYLEEGHARGKIVVTVT
jgi:NADPH:quinone reductase-like Zn-dependent oxidoreductase